MTERAGCPAPRHDTRHAYNRLGCACPEALRAETRYRKQRQVRALAGIPAPHKPVDATATRRRIEALAAVGWSMGDLAGRLGVKWTAVQQWHTRSTVKPDTERRVHALYDELWNVPGPSDKAREHAQRQGWLPPLWWDDDQIGDPAYDPRKDVVAAVEIRDELRRERIERVVRLTEHDRLSTRQVAEKLGLHDRQVTRDLADWRKGQQTVDELEAVAS